TSLHSSALLRPPRAMLPWLRQKTRAQERECSNVSAVKSAMSQRSRRYLPAQKSMAGPLRDHPRSGTKSFSHIVTFCYMILELGMGSSRMAAPLHEIRFAQPPYGGFDSANG